MKEKIRKLLQLLSIVLLVGLYGCERDFEDPQNNQNPVAVKKYSYNKALQIPQFKKSSSNVVNAFAKMSANTAQNSREGLEDLVIDETTVKEISIGENYTTYTMLVVNDDPSSKSFENLIIEVKPDITNAYLVEYTPSKDIEYNAEHDEYAFEGQLTSRMQIGLDPVTGLPVGMGSGNGGGEPTGGGGGSGNYMGCVSVLLCNANLTGGIGDIHYAGSKCTRTYSSLECNWTPSGTGGSTGTGNPNYGGGTSGSGTPGSNGPVTSPVVPKTPAERKADIFKAEFYDPLPINLKAFLQANNPIYKEIKDYIIEQIDLTEDGDYIPQEMEEFVKQVINEIMNTPVNPIAPNITLVGGDLTNKISDITDYLKCFDSTQPAVFTLYVDQPTANSNAPWSGNPVNPNVGHTFVSIKQGTVRRVLGFYPSTSVNLDNPATTGICKNDSAEEFDVSLSLNVNISQLNNILNYIKFKASTTYNLNTFNCTDFGMSVMSLAGITIPSAYGTWGATGIGSGAGDNPGQLGQNIRNMPVSSGVVKTTSSGNAQSNMGTCP